ncbi:Arc family DNA-binding protein [Atlantibacter sp. RC6]|uniref:Arc family DNA-binding protein n=1 Tax=Atlantibacter sp. RC6 TaxID=2587036 RepID=UPI0016057235|nr:Arc family DNA-binding protein [Atlantibacter sp. RC6]MBB3320900.1 putative DNA-binding protein [Atlantibacter sp. RC6]
MKVRDIAPYGVRMPTELKEKLQEIAKRNGRSLNSEIVRILEEYVTPPHIDELRSPTTEEIQSPEKMQEWIKELNSKINTLERVIQKNFPNDASNKKPT